MDIIKAAQYAACAEELNRLNILLEQQEKLLVRCARGPIREGLQSFAEAQRAQNDHIQKELSNLLSEENIQ